MKITSVFSATPAISFSGTGMTSRCRVNVSMRTIRCHGACASLRTDQGARVHVPSRNLAIEWRSNLQVGLKLRNCPQAFLRRRGRFL